MIRSAGLFFAAGLCALAAVPAAAQDRTEGDPDNLIVAFGVGPQMLPSYPGADDYQVQPLFGGYVRREGEPIPFRSPDDGFGFSLIGRGGVIELGPLLQFQNKRDEEDAGAPIGDVDFTVEAGAFVNLNITDHIRARAEVRRGIGGHESWLGDAGIDFAFRSGSETIFTIGPRVRVADAEYMRAYFGVTPAVASATGLPVYDPEGGIRSVGAIAGFTHQLSPSFGLYAYAGYDRLVGDAADSPIVRTLGSRDQYSGGIALFYTFRMRNPFR